MTTPLAAPDALPPAFGRALALNAEGGAPGWIMLLPKGPAIEGRDGRQWRMSDPARIVAAFAANRAALPVDLEHSQFQRAPQALEAPAMGWIEEVETRDGAVWGRVDWTPKGAALVADKSYRYSSPVFTFDPRSREVAALRGAGLVNRPNLDTAALNRSDSPMDLSKIAAALGLPETASAEDILAAIAAMKNEKAELAANRAATPPADKFVAIATYQTALNRAETAERALAAQAQAAREAEIAALVDGAVEGGKVAPADKDFYLAACRAEGGVERFKTFVGAKAVDPAARKSGLDDKALAETGSKLTADELAVCRAVGVSEEEYRKARGA